MEFRDIQKLVYQPYKKNGFEQKWNDAEKILKDSNKPELAGMIVLAELMLSVTEQAEAAEEIRNTDKKKFALELAGLIIRALNIATRKNIDLEPLIIAETNRNMNRPILHGRTMI